MNVTIQNLYVLPAPDITGLFATLKERISEMAEALDTLITRVSEIETVADSAIEVMAALKTQLDEAIASGDPAALTALSERLGAQTQELADAILANTDAPA